MMLGLKGSDIFQYDLSQPTTHPTLWGVTLGNYIGNLYSSKFWSRCDWTKHVLYIASIDNTDFVVDIFDITTKQRIGISNQQQVITITPPQSMNIINAAIYGLFNQVFFFGDLTNGNQGPNYYYRVDLVSGAGSGAAAGVPVAISGISQDGYFQNVRSFVQMPVKDTLLVTFNFLDLGFTVADQQSPCLYDIPSNTINCNSSTVTHQMVTTFMTAYTWSLCGGKIVKTLIEVTSSFDYSVICKEPDSFHYQSPNIWASSGTECRYLQPYEFSTSCAAYKTAISNLVASSCPSSINKVCRAAIVENPPFTCTRTLPVPPLTIIANSIANTNALWGGLAVLVATILVHLSKSKDKQNESNKYSKNDDAQVHPINDDKIEAGETEAHPTNQELESNSAPLPLPKEKPPSLSLLSQIVGAILPQSYFKLDDSVKSPKAPHNALVISVSVELGLTAIAFALLFNYFYGLTYMTTVVSNTLLGAGYNCTVLIPREGVGYLASETSENIQLTGSAMNHDECVSYLKSHDLCNKNRLDQVAVAGLSGISSTNLPSQNSGYAAIIGEGLLTKSFIQHVFNSKSIYLMDDGTFVPNIPQNTFKSFGYTLQRPSPPVAKILVSNTACGILQGGTYSDVYMFQQLPPYPYIDEVAEIMYRVKTENSKTFI